MTPSALAGTLPNLEAFCRTFETGSFTKAAHACGVTPQATSRSVARLEEALGVTLFRRSTRSLAPTPAAREYYERCARALALLSDGERELSNRSGIAEGKVRISVPDRPGSLGRVTSAIGVAGADIVKVDVLENEAGRALDDVFVEVRDQEHLEQVRDRLAALPGVTVTGVQRPAPPVTGHADLELLDQVLSRPERGLPLLARMRELQAAVSISTADALSFASDNRRYEGGIEC